MMRLAALARRPQKLSWARTATNSTRALTGSSGRNGATTKSTQATAGQRVESGGKGAGAGAAEGGGSGSFAVLSVAAMTASLLASSLQMETDSEFRATAESYIPSVLEPVFNETRGVLRSSGIVDLISAKPQSPGNKETVQKDDVQEVEVDISKEDLVVEEEAGIQAIDDAIGDSSVLVEVIEEALVPVESDEHRVETFDASDVDQLEPLPPPADNAPLVDVAHESVEANTSESVCNLEEIQEEPASPVREQPVSSVQDTPTSPVPQLHSASAQLESEHLDESSHFTRELERRFLGDIDNLDTDTLRIRIRELVSDYSNRSKWEALKLHQAIRHLEKELADHYSSAFGKQQTELELRLERELSKKETEVRIEMSHIINDLREAQEFRIQDALKTQEQSLKSAFEKERMEIETSAKNDAELAHQSDMANFKMEEMNKLLELHKALEDATSHVSYFNKMADYIAEEKRQSARVHEESAAVLALEAVMCSSMPIKRELDAVKKVCETDSVVAVLLDTVPEHICKHGALTLPELRARFSVAKEEARKASLAPSNAPKMVGQMIGSVLASLLWEVEGNVSGESDEAVLARTSYYLDHGKLKPAVEELSKLRGYPKSLLHDWELCAKDRMVVDQTLSSMKAAVSLEHLES